MNIGDDQQPPAYEPPHVRVLGSLHELTQVMPCPKPGNGPPDFASWIPLSNCSS